jgi:hypothetical protein
MAPELSVTSSWAAAALSHDAVISSIASAN